MIEGRTSSKYPLEGTPKWTWCMGEIAEMRGQMRCDMTVQVLSTPIGLNHSRKLTSK